MRKALTLLLLGISTAAVDAREFSAPVLETAASPWSGTFFALTGGYGWLNDIDRGQAPPFSDYGQGWIHGASVGYLSQMGALAFGTEVEFTRLDMRFELSPIPIFAERSLAIKTRVGVAFGDVLLSAFAGPTHATTDIGLKGWGWSSGLNVDYALTRHITIGAQYSHSVFNQFDGTLIDARLDLLTARLSWRH